MILDRLSKAENAFYSLFAKKHSRENTCMEHFDVAKSAVVSKP